MNLIDAYFIHPVAVEHARHVLQGELDMLHNGIGKRKRIEWLTAQRDTLCIDAAINIPLTLRPMLDALSTKDAVRTLGLVQNNLRALGAGTTFRALRNTQRRNGLPVHVFDTLTLNGAFLLLGDDVEFCAVFKDLIDNVFADLEQSPVYEEMNREYALVQRSVDLESNKQRRLMHMTVEKFPSLIDHLNFDAIDDRSAAYLYGRLLDQDLLASLSAIVSTTGTGIFEVMHDAIAKVGITTYRHVLVAIINDRIAALSDDTKRTTEPVVEALNASATKTNAPAEVTSEKQIPEFLSIQETADYLRVTPITIQRLLKSGALKSVYVGRRRLVLQTSIETYLDMKK